MQTAASVTTYPVKAGLKWWRTYHASSRHRSRRRARRGSPRLGRRPRHPRRVRVHASSRRSAGHSCRRWPCSRLSRRSSAASRSQRSSRSSAHESTATSGWLRSIASASCRSSSSRARSFRSSGFPTALEPVAWPHRSGAGRALPGSVLRAGRTAADRRPRHLPPQRHCGRRRPGGASVRRNAQPMTASTSASASSRACRRALGAGGVLVERESRQLRGAWLVVVRLLRAALLPGRARRRRRAWSATSMSGVKPSRTRISWLPPCWPRPR